MDGWVIFFSALLDIFSSQRRSLHFGGGFDLDIVFVWVAAFKCPIDTTTPYIYIAGANLNFFSSFRIPRLCCKKKTYGNSWSQHDLPTHQFACRVVLTYHLRLYFLFLLMIEEEEKITNSNSKFKFKYNTKLKKGFTYNHISPIAAQLS